MADKNIRIEESEDEEEEVLEEWDDWQSDEEESVSEFLCLFCDEKYSSVDSLFGHAASAHFFDFPRIRETLGLDFYGCFKLINYIRSQVVDVGPPQQLRKGYLFPVFIVSPVLRERQVSESKCWSCGMPLQSKKDMLNHLHETESLKDIKHLWEDDKYLKPFMQEDSILHCFMEDDDGDKDYNMPVDKDKLFNELAYSEDLKKVFFDEENVLGMVLQEVSIENENGNKGESSSSNGPLNLSKSLEKLKVNGTENGEGVRSPPQKTKDKNLKVSFANVAAKEINNVNKHYFGGYGSYAIHREMISDKVRTDAYSGAILNNSSLIKGAVVLDVGCGTGILSLFAARAGASRVIAVEASEKMARVATQIARDNGLLVDENPSGVISVVHCMIEDLGKSLEVPPHSVDVLVSEWMGYCLLYETMLGSVLYARDRWLKPGGAILPDTATIFVAGFGKGGTSIPFWENVYGFDMSCIGKEVVEDAAQVPIVDVVDSQDIVTNTVALQTFDLLTMKSDDMDFTATCELKLKRDFPEQKQTRQVSCYGVVLWFETGFTSRFCKEAPSVLSTSPYTPKTHWSQTILTFQEPITMTLVEANADDALAALGSDACPVATIQSRISIVRAAQHRSIDISLEVSGTSFDGRKRSWPVQIFNL